MAVYRIRSSPVGREAVGRAIRMFLNRLSVRVIRMPIEQGLPYSFQVLLLFFNLASIFGSFPAQRRSGTARHKAAPLALFVVPGLSTVVVRVGSSRHSGSQYGCIPVLV